MKPLSYPLLSLRGINSVLWNTTNLLCTTSMGLSAGINLFTDRKKLMMLMHGQDPATLLNTDADALLVPDLVQN